jgi:hypothetical protein
MHWRCYSDFFLPDIGTKFPRLLAIVNLRRGICRTYKVDFLIEFSLYARANNGTPDQIMILYKSQIIMILHVFTLFFPKFYEVHVRMDQIYCWLLWPL